MCDCAVYVSKEKNLSADEIMKVCTQGHRVEIIGPAEMDNVTGQIISYPCRLFEKTGEK